MNPPSTSPQQLLNAITSSGLPAPSPAFLTSLLTPNANTGRIPPLAALVATARLRILTYDISQPSILAPTVPSFPPTITDARVVQTVLGADTPCQVLDIEDISKSKWEQIEALESERKGEMTRGRQVIQVLAEPEEGVDTQAPSQVARSPAAPTKSSGPFKLLLQDRLGQKCYAFELARVDKIGYPPYMSIGTKLLLRKDCKTARGTILLQPASVLVLGGKIETLDKTWREGREARLRAEVEQPRA